MATIWRRLHFGWHRVKDRPQYPLTCTFQKNKKNLEFSRFISKFPLFIKVIDTPIVISAILVPSIKSDCVERLKFSAVCLS